jgi:hypothetical protein
VPHKVELCREQVEWTKAEKRTFLRHRVELRLASLYVDTQEYTAALALIASCVPLPPQNTAAPDAQHTRSSTHRSTGC